MSSEPVLAPTQLPSDTHEVIAVLETIHVPWEPVDLSPKTYEALVYYKTKADEDDVVARIKSASIVICTTCRLTGETLGRAPFLKCIIGHAVGTDHVDLEYCRRNNIQVMNSTNCNSETVAEHAISLYFATRRSIVTIHNTLTDFTSTRPNEWKTKGSMNTRMRDSTGAPPRTCREEVAGIVGYGAVGKHIARLCTALGMKVVIAERKGGPSATASAPARPNGHQQLPPPPPPPLPSSSSPSPSEKQDQLRPSRVPFTQLLQTGTVIFLALPLLPSTRSLLSTPELALLSPDSVLVNVSRGGIVDETAVLAALTSRRIFGYGTDVFSVEPAGDDRDSVLLGGGGGAAAEGGVLNLTMTGHLAWLSRMTVANQKRRVGENLRAWVDGVDGWGDVVVPSSRK